MLHDRAPDRPGRRRSAPPANAARRPSRGAALESRSPRGHAQMAHPLVDCQADPSAGSDAPAVLIATVPGRDAGTSALVQALNALPGFGVRGFASGAGWMHLSEFTQRWIGIRRKMEDPNDPDHAYFEQFQYSRKDGFPPSAEHSDFRSLDELLRRKIKPAWYHFFNLTHVLCRVRQLVLHQYNPKGAGFFGFVHMFHPVLPPAGRADTDSVDATLKEYSSHAALRSLDLFLHLFPVKGRVIANLPLVPLPDARLPRSRCICLAGGNRCNERAWPDPRVPFMQQLLNHSANRPHQSLAFSAQAGGPRAASELLSFLGQPASLLPRLEDALEAGRRSWISARLRWGSGRNATSGSPEKQQVGAQTAARPVDVCDGAPVRTAEGIGAHPVTASDPWCMQPGCVAASTATGQACQACAASFVDIAWGQNVRAGGAGGRLKPKASDTRQGGQGGKPNKLAKLAKGKQGGKTKAKAKTARAQKNVRPAKA